MKTKRGMKMQFSGDDFLKIINSVEDQFGNRLNTEQIKKIMRAHPISKSFFGRRSLSGAASNCKLRNYDRGGV